MLTNSPHSPSLAWRWHARSRSVTRRFVADDMVSFATGATDAQRPCEREADEQDLHNGDGYDFEG